MKTSIISVACIIFFVGASGATSILTLDSGVNLNQAADYSNNGWTFTAHQNILVTELGLYDENQDGFGEFHDVGLFRLNDGALLTSGQLSAGTGNTLVDNFRYVDTADVQLTAGVNYVISFHSTLGLDGLISDADNLVVDPAITILYANWQEDTSGLIMPENTTEFDLWGADRFGPNFLYSIPEPSSIAMIGLVGFCSVFFRRRFMS